MATELFWIGIQFITSSAFLADIVAGAKILTDNVNKCRRIAEERDPMKSIRSTSVIVALCAVFAATSTRALAVPLADLIQGQTVMADDKLFSNWQLTQLDLTGDAVADLDMIDVTPLTDDPLNPGLKFTAPVGALGTDFDNAGNSSANLVFSFDAQTTDGRPLIKDNSLLINGFVFDSGPQALINISETISDASGIALEGKFVQAQPSDVGMEGLLPSHFDEANFAPQASVHVVKMIEIIGPGMFDGAFLTMFEQRFSQVPEPSCTAFACIAVLFGLACHRQRSA
jgi:hypothetical protein